MPFQPPQGAPPAFPPGPPPPPMPPGPAAGPPPQVEWGQPPPGYYGPPPVTAGSLIERTFKIWWANVGKLVGVSLVILVPALVLVGVVVGAAAVGLSLKTTSGSPDPSQAFGMVGGMVAVALVVILPLATIMLGGINYGVIQWLAGRPAGVGDMLKQGGRRIWGILLTLLLVMVAVLGGYVLLIVPGIMIANATALAVPATTVEGGGAVQSFQRSLELTRGYRWPLFGAFLAVMAINFVASMMASVLTFIPVLGVLLNLAISVITATIPYVLPAVAYHDLRVAKEGVDTSQLAQVFE
jgi:hypothetical protein